MTAARFITRRQALVELAARAARESLSACLDVCWPYMNPGVPLVRGWALDAVVEHAEAFIVGEIPILGIAVPPGSSKTSVASKAAPLFAWLKHPEWRFICASYDVPFSVDLNRDRRDLIQNARLRALLKPEYSLRRGDRAAGKFSNDRGGWMMATSPDSRVTGYHANRFILDDSVKPKDVYSPRLDKHEQWFRETAPSRFREPSEVRLMAVSQRLHQRDSVGLLKDMYPDAVILRIPAEGDPRRRCVTVLGIVDPRRKVGESFNPERYPPSMYEEKRRQLGRQMYSAQYQQEPLVDGGAILFTEHFANRYRDIPDTAKARGYWLFSVDCAFDGGEANDNAVIQVWLEHRGTAWLVAQVRGQMTFTETQDALDRLRAIYPGQRKILIEGGGSGNGDAIANALGTGRPGAAAERFKGIEVVKPKESKGTRAQVVVPLLESGAVLFPEDGVAPWMPALVAEAESFTGRPGLPDDQIDAMTQALGHLAARLARAGQVPSAARRRPPADPNARRDHLDEDF